MSFFKKHNDEVIASVVSVSVLWGGVLQGLAEVAVAARGQEHDQQGPRLLLYVLLPGMCHQ